MGYVLIPLVVSVVLALHHVAVTEAPRVSKLAVVVIIGLSLVVWFYYPRWLVFATLAQVAAGIYMIVWQKLH